MKRGTFMGSKYGAAVFPASGLRECIAAIPNQKSVSQSAPKWVSPPPRVIVESRLPEYGTSWTGPIQAHHGERISKR